MRFNLRQNLLLPPVNLSVLQPNLWPLLPPRNLPLLLALHLKPNLLRHLLPKPLLPQLLRKLHLEPRLNLQLLKHLATTHVQLEMTATLALTAVKAEDLDLDHVAAEVGLLVMGQSVNTIAEALLEKKARNEKQMDLATGGKPV